ncbi:hypothetical protein BG005_001631, partial [Podila minutissima]
DDGADDDEDDDEDDDKDDGVDDDEDDGTDDDEDDGTDDDKDDCADDDKDDCADDDNDDDPSKTIKSTRTQSSLQELGQDGARIPRNHTAQGPRTKVDSSNTSLLVVMDFVILACSNRPCSPNPGSASAQEQRAPDDLIFWCTFSTLLCPKL